MLCSQDFKKIFLSLGDLPLTETLQDIYNLWLFYSSRIKFSVNQNFETQF